MIDGLVGLPWSEGGRDRGGIDCWGLVRLYYMGLGVDLPAFCHRTGDFTSLGPEELAGWVMIPQPEKAGDVLVYQRPRSRLHVGVYVGRGRMLHIDTDQPSGIVDLTHPRLGRRIGVYRRAI